MQLYENIIKSINTVIEHYKNEKVNSQFTETHKHYLLQGLHIALQLVHQDEESDTNVNNYAYESLEHILNVYKEVYMNTPQIEEFKELLEDTLLDCQ